MKVFSTRFAFSAFFLTTLSGLLLAVANSPSLAATAAQQWQGHLTPISAADWNAERAAHLLERAGFGGTPDDIREFTTLSPELAVNRLVNYHSIDNSELPAFDHSGIHDPGLEPFPPSRPATTTLARETGSALGVNVKPSGNRRLQPVVNRFFYWLRASMLETHRLAYWWANRMLNSKRPLEEKMALFWHGHFATNEAKVRDYRKLHQQLALFHQHGIGNFRDLLIGVAQGPAMLAFLDAGVNVKGSPNENFAREIMELFTMGVGHYQETDIREAARAFTGWNYVDLKFIINADQHDETDKRFLGHSDNYDGVEIIDIILAQPVTAEFIASKIYRYFVRQDPATELQQRLGTILRDNNYELAPLLTTIFLSKDFYSTASIGSRIKSPVELVVSTYKKLGLREVPGVPDFNAVTKGLGQQLFYPPTVAGWAQGRSWITPGLLLARSNFARDVVWPDINFIPHDRFPRDSLIRGVSEKLAQGYDISNATVPDTGGGMMAMSNQMADRDEDFNTRYGSYKGWQTAIQKVKPIPRATAQLDLRAMVMTAELATSEQVVDYFIKRFLQVPVSPTYRQELIAFLQQEIGTKELAQAHSYLEEPLRMLIHLIMSAPEYQLG